jgi:hypothetical protein
MNTAIISFALKSASRNADQKISELLDSEVFLKLQDLGLVVQDNSGFQSLTYNALKKITKCYTNNYHSGFKIAINVVKQNNILYILVCVITGKKLSVVNKISLENLDESKLKVVSEVLEAFDFYDSSYDEYDEYSSYELTSDGIMTHFSST